MSGNRLGGLRAAATNKARYGEDYYKRLGRVGGRISRAGGFAKDRELARAAGRKGGLASHRCSTNHRYQLWLGDEKVFDGSLKGACHFAGYSKTAVFYNARHSLPLGPYEVTIYDPKQR